jgi:phosphoglycerate dehydrogenase-like enzyme
MEMAHDLATAVADADHLVLAAPATADTRHLIDARVFDAARPGVHLVNIARGALVDQDALRAALDDGRVALASLDVCDPEPLPAGHWLYSHERVHLSPHISWLGRGVLESYTTTFVENYHRFRAGRELIDVVDRDAGY